MPVEIKPMLAKLYDSSKFKPGMFVQRKLNGIRALYQDGNFVSRRGEIWSDQCLTELRRELQSVIPPGIILDGELYKHGMSLQQINSRIAVNRVTPHPRESEVEYHIFDTIDYTPFYDRFVFWSQQISPKLRELKLPKLVATYQLDDPNKIDQLYLHVKREGFEGLMYRDPHAPYCLPHLCGNKENRSPHLLKRKGWFDLDAIIIGCVNGDVGTKYEQILGSFVVQWGDVVFSTGTGLSDTQRHRYWVNRDKMLGCVVKIRYEELSDLKTPLRNRIILVEEPTDL